MERVKCLKCGKIGYTASPEKARCDKCNLPSKGIIRLSYKALISSASIYTDNESGIKFKINVSVTILLEDKTIFFVNNLTFCSLNEAKHFDYTELLRKKREDLFKCKKPTLTNEASYLYIIDKRLHGGVR